uniref:Uncharacterized protein n=1 Tax=Myotis myotis TaxID=51298 RepID=A0A7J7R422_MYOMY|nr:hypothetical protein mMyoMyo1_010922 [Myotis myotis]
MSHSSGQLSLGWSEAQGALWAPKPAARGCRAAGQTQAGRAVSVRTAAGTGGRRRAEKPHDQAPQSGHEAWCLSLRTKIMYPSVFKTGKEGAGSQSAQGGIAVRAGAGSGVRRGRLRRRDRLARSGGAAAANPAQSGAAAGDA